MLPNPVTKPKNQVTIRKDAYETFDTGDIRTFVRARPSAIKTPSKVPKVNISRDGGVGSFRTRLGISPAVVSVRPAVDRRLAMQTGIIDGHLKEHKKVAGVEEEEEAEACSSDSSF